MPVPHRAAHPSPTRTAPALVLALIAAAWITLVVWGASPWRRYLDHGSWDDVAWLVAVCRGVPEGPRMIGAGAYAGAWLLMIVAMMLPTTLPLLALFGRMVAGRTDAGRLVAAVVTGYALAWLGFGVLAWGIDAGIRTAAVRSGWLVLHGWVVGAVVIGAAGAFQFSALKYRCLERCRTPFGFVNSRWRGMRPFAESLRLGIDHGLFCVGCCWALMLVTFVVGMGSIGWMLLLAAAMAAEKNLRRGTMLRAPVGLALLAWAGIIVLTNT